MIGGAARRILRRRFPGLLSALHSYRFNRRLQARKFAMTAHGFRFRGHEAMEKGTFEPDEVALIQSFAGSGTVFVDVGANFGYHVCLARQQGSHVVAIEPLAENLAVLFDNLEINGWIGPAGAEEGIEIFPMALSGAPGAAVLYGGGTAASLIKEWAGQSEVWKRVVAISTLDIILDDRFAGRPLFVKIDVEGFEHDVLRGSDATLARTPAPRWMVEICLTEHHPDRCNPHFEAIFQTFWRHGYIARTVERESRLVLPTDVSRWLANGKRDFGHINYFFERS